MSGPLFPSFLHSHSVEIIRFVHSMWINFDQEMFFTNGEDGIPAKARTTTLNEELGQVQYIFSDKTGTLTCNIMAFNKCSINGISYGDVYDSRGNALQPSDVEVGLPQKKKSPRNCAHSTFRRTRNSNLPSNSMTSVCSMRLGAATKRSPSLSLVSTRFQVTEFWRLLALCHTVMPERDKSGLLTYQAQSPDEAALTSAARNFGFVFRSRTPQSITIEVNGKEEVRERQELEGAGLRTAVHP